MENRDIVRIEEDVTNLSSKLAGFRKVNLPERSSKNYNYLGTLDANLKWLAHEISKTVKELNFK